MKESKFHFIPPAKSITKLEHMSWLTETNYEEEIIQPLFGISQAINKRNEEDLLDNFISNSEEETQINQIPINPIFESSFQEISVDSISNSHIKTIEIFPGKNLNINSDLEVSQEKNMVELFR